MGYELDVFLDFLYEMWAYQYPKTAAIMLGLWLVYLASKLVCIVDFGWALCHFIIGLTLCVQYPKIVNYRGWIMLGILTLWFINLGGYMLLRFFTGFIEKRYEEMAKGKSDTSKKLYFLMQFQMQAIIVVLTATPLYFVFRKYDEDANEVRWTFIVGAVMCLAGIAGQHLADRQLRSYKKARGELKGNRVIELNPSNYQTVGGQGHQHDEMRFPGTLKRGLWSHSRHPNLFFDLITWLGFALAGLNDYSLSFLGFFGPLLLFCLMRFATIPITEKTMADTRPYWKEYVKETNMFLPVF
jgi:steroid 5-alpha reductase family enzyme